MLPNPIPVMLGDGFQQSSGHTEDLLALFEGKATALHVDRVEGGYHPLSLADAEEIDPVLEFFRSHTPS